MNTSLSHSRGMKIVYDDTHGLNESAMKFNPK